MKPEIQCMTCDRIKYGCMVRPNGKVKCPLYVQIKLHASALAGWIIGSVSVLGLIEVFVLALK